MHVYGLYKQTGSFYSSDTNTRLVGSFATEDLAKAEKARREKNYIDDHKGWKTYLIDKIVIRDWEELNVGDRVEFNAVPMYIPSGCKNKVGTITRIIKDPKGGDTGYEVHLDEPVREKWRFERDKYDTYENVTVYTDQYFERITE